MSYAHGGAEQSDRIPQLHRTGSDRSAGGFAQAWKRLGVRLDGVYTGFLCNNRQIDFVSSFVRDFAEPGILVLIDPVLADNGQYYALFDHNTCRAMSSLIRQATVITPNLTEACFLTGRTAGDYAALAAKPDPDIILEMARTLSRSGPETVVISGIPAGEEIAILGYQSRKDEAVWVKNRRIGPATPGREISSPRCSADVLSGEEPVLCAGKGRLPSGKVSCPRL